MTDPLELLAALDEPRPLPAELRARIEDALLAGDEARPLEAGLTQRLSGRMTDPVAGLLDGLDAARPLSPQTRSDLVRRLPTRPVRRPGRWLAAAASGLAASVAAVYLLGGHSQSPGSTAAGRPTPSPSVVQATSAPANATGGAAGSTALLPSTPAPTTQPVPAAVAAGGAAAGAPGRAGTPSPTGGASPTGTPAPAPPPRADSVSPSTGPAQGGTWVTIDGADLNRTTAVHFGATAATRIDMVSATRVRALSPAHTAGPVDVTVTTPGGTSGPVRFLYLP
jgi:hypothetical protein